MLYNQSFKKVFSSFNYLHSNLLQQIVNCAIEFWQLARLKAIKILFLYIFRQDLVGEALAQFRFFRNLNHDYDRSRVYAIFINVCQVSF